MEIVNDRECEIVELSNGDKLYFLSKYKGREYRFIRNQQASNMHVEDGKTVIPDMSKITMSVDDSFPVLCMKAVTKDGAEKERDTNYLDNLDVSDYVTVTTKLADSMRSVLTQEYSKKG